MKKIVLLTVVCAGFAAPLLADSTNLLGDERSRVSYAIGMKIGAGWKQNGIDVNNDLVLKGLNDAESGAMPLMTPQEIQMTLAEYQKTMMAKQQAMRAEMSAKNRVEGETFLATNKTNPGVITLADGLQYKVITDGTGPVPTRASTVTVNYTGRFISGTVFDSSEKTGHPAQFPVGGVIPGWTEALQLMKAGSKWQLYVPSNLAYGPQGNRAIPPDTALIFDIELLAVQAPPPPPPAVQNPPLTSDIIKVPSKAELDKGAKIEVIKPEDIQKAQSEATNAAH